ncbi:MAG TPA: type II toxin-antitoxin system HicB family antitoxin [Longimicrobium sp.]|nr:type II toxin-antitoxin system HicB family antitoxin [Longimicrobium sp.]
MVIAEVPGLPGCMAHGDTYEEALAMAQEGMRAWIDVARELGRPVPEPKGRKLMYA